jgi:hypothetical protein
MGRSISVAPTFYRVPDGRELTGKDCVELATAYGVLLDDWQRSIVRGILRESPGGGWSASQAGLVVARQSGKGQIILAVELFGLFALGEVILHTAHAVKTSSDAFRRLWQIVTAHEDLACRVVRHSQATGAEFVELEGGARIAFTTRSASSGRGLSIDRLVVDEAEDLPAPEVGALAPTVFARPRAQSLYFGTAPGPLHDSEAFATMRASAHNGLNPRLAWWEWCAQWGDDVDDEALWVRVNPAVATGRVSLQAIVDDRAVLPIDQFRAERLSMWPPKSARQSVVSAARWRDMFDIGPADDVKPDGFGIDMSHGRDISVAACWIEGDSAHLEEVWAGRDPALMVEWLTGAVDRRTEVVVDGVSPAASLAADLRARRIAVYVTSAAQMGQACGMFENRANVDPPTLTHGGQQQLTDAVSGAVRRPIRDAGGWGWDRSDPTAQIHPIVAGTLALFAATRKRRRTGDRQVRKVVVLS